MEEQKKIMENEHLSSLEKLKEREEEIRQLHNVCWNKNKNTTLMNAVKTTCGLIIYWS